MRYRQQLARDRARLAHPSAEPRRKVYADESFYLAPGEEADLMVRSEGGDVCVARVVGGVRGWRLRQTVRVGPGHQ